MTFADEAEETLATRFRHAPRASSLSELRDRLVQD
jgi:hypothetical protein